MFKEHSSHSSGQALVEVAVFLPVLLILAIGAIRWLGAEWDRFRCSYLAFEITHARLTGSRPPPYRFRFRYTDQGRSVLGEAWCNGAKERVALPKLEASP